MQFSSNSNEAVRALIRACPTPAGQYRQAILQIRDREMALQQHNRVSARHEHLIAIKKIEKQRLIEQKAGDVTEAEILKHQVALINIDIEEADSNLRASQLLVEDAIREIAACRDEIERILNETGIDFGKVETEEFQQYMTEDYKLKRVRFIASRMMGFAPDAAEALLEIPVYQREEYMMLLGHVLAGFGSLNSNSSEVRSLNGAN